MQGLGGGQGAHTLHVCHHMPEWPVSCFSEGRATQFRTQVFKAGEFICAPSYLGRKTALCNAAFGVIVVKLSGPQIEVAALNKTETWNVMYETTKEEP